MSREPLYLVAEALDGSAALAFVHGDHAAACRLLRLAESVEHEGEYEANVARGLERVHHRSGKSLGWLLSNDPGVRDRRRALGVWVP